MRRSYGSTCDVKRENSKNRPYLALNCEPPLTWIQTAFRHVMYGDLFYKNYLEFGRLSQQRSFQLCSIVKIPVFLHKSTTTATEKQERRLPLTLFNLHSLGKKLEQKYWEIRTKTDLPSKYGKGTPLTFFQVKSVFVPELNRLGPKLWPGVQQIQRCLRLPRSLCGSGDRPPKVPKIPISFVPRPRAGPVSHLQSCTAHENLANLSGFPMTP